MAQLPPLLIRLADWLLMSPVLFSHLERRGVTVYLWVLNTEEQYEREYARRIRTFQRCDPLE